MPWVTLNRVKNLRKAGVLHTYRPGDSVEVGKQTAIEWILDGSAEDPYGQVGPSVIPDGGPTNKFGVRVRAKEGSFDAERGLGVVAHRVKISFGPPAIPYIHTLIWKPTKLVSVKLVQYGFVTILSDRKPIAWDLAASLVSDSQLAKDIGSSDEKEKTNRVIGDLRIPVYDTRFVWARKCSASEAVIAEWASELANGADEQHAFLRALYSKRAALCTLPRDWMPR